MTIGLVLIGAFGVLRALAPSVWLVVLLTWPVGIGMGLGNALAPLAVRETIPDRPATGTGVYTTGIQMGSACRPRSPCRSRRCSAAGAAR